MREDMATNFRKAGVVEEEIPLHKEDPNDEILSSLLENLPLPFTSLVIPKLVKSGTNLEKKKRGLTIW